MKKKHKLDILSPAEDTSDVACSVWCLYASKRGSLSYVMRVTHKSRQGLLKQQGKLTTVS